MTQSTACITRKITHTPRVEFRIPGSIYFLQNGGGGGGDKEINGGFFLERSRREISIDASLDVDIFFVFFVSRRRENQRRKSSAACVCVVLRAIRQGALLCKMAFEIRLLIAHSSQRTIFYVFLSCSHVFWGRNYLELVSENSCRVVKRFFCHRKGTGYQKS